MGEKLTLVERYKFLRRIHKEYRQSTKKKKNGILNIVCQTTGLHRKRLIEIFSQKIVVVPYHKRKGVVILSRYKSDQRLINYLISFWRLSDFSCGKLFKPQINTFLPFYEKEYGKIEERIKEKLLTISPATIDRVLTEEKRKNDYKTLKKRDYSKQNTFLKNLIPIKTHLEWDFNVDVPGHLQVDLVSHDGGSLRGDFIQSLNMVDYKTGWEVVRACLNKAASNVVPQIKISILLFPFKVLEIHPDTGAEFINSHLYRFCQQNNILFTRSRPYKKDDNFWVENRNDKVVRKNVGYKRYQGKIDFFLLNLLYENLYFYLNFFKPQRRCLEKIKIGSRIKKLYDQPQTPYERVLQEKSVNEKEKEKLINIYKSLNPIKVRKEIIKLQNILLKDDKIKMGFVEKLKLQDKPKLDFY